MPERVIHIASPGEQARAVRAFVDLCRRADRVGVPTHRAEEALGKRYEADALKLLVRAVSEAEKRR